MNRWLVVFAGASALPPLLASACAPVPRARQHLDEAVVATAYDSEAIFSDYTTFSVSMRVATADVAEDGRISTGRLDQAGSDIVVAHVALLMKERGYRLVEAPETPDLGIAIGAVTGSQTTTLCAGHWSGDYGAYWGYPGALPYYAFATSYAYRTGSLVIDMLDLKHAPLRSSAPGSSDAGKLSGRRGIEVVWTAVAYRAVPELSVGPGDFSAAIDLVFLQSPYLHK